MGDDTILDRAHATMLADDGNEAARLAFYDRLAHGELFLLLTTEAEGDKISPELFDLSDGRFVLAFDREERLARFAGRPAPYAALSGRALARMLAGQGIGLALNPEVAPSSILLPAEALQWLVDLLAQAPREIEARIDEVLAPAGLPETLIEALDARLASAAGLADAAYLAGVRYDDGGRGHLLAFVAASAGAEPALAAMVGEALSFSGIEAGAIDVAFLAAADAVVPQLARVALRFDLPEPEPVRPVRAAPGSDPSRPPILR